MASSSSVEQYIPSRYSSTKVGTFAPRFMSDVRSLRTILPPKCSNSLQSSSSASYPTGWPSSNPSVPHSRAASASCSPTPSPACAYSSQGSTSGTSHKSSSYSAAMATPFYILRICAQIRIQTCRLVRRKPLWCTVPSTQCAQFRARAPPGNTVLSTRNSSL